MVWGSFDDLQLHSCYVNVRYLDILIDLVYIAGLNDWSACSLESHSQGGLTGGERGGQDLPRVRSGEKYQDTRTECHQEQGPEGVGDEDQDRTLQALHVFLSELPHGPRDGLVQRFWGFINLRQHKWEAANIKVNLVICSNGIISSPNPFTGNLDMGSNHMSPTTHPNDIYELLA